MKIGYACINDSINCTSNSTFRLNSYSQEKLKETIKNNLDCLYKILRWNVEHNIYFFRLGSQLVPFASHPINKFNWEKYFKNDFKKIGNFIKKNKIKISMHPDQFVVLNSQRKDVIENSIRELEYHCKVLDLMGLSSKAKVMVHVGGVYGDKIKAIQKFIETYKNLSPKIKKRLVIENDDKSYTLKDCLEINKKIKIPVVFDVFHHECVNNGESIKKAIQLAQKTWTKKDGTLIVHYSYQQKGKKRCSHAESLDLKKFKKFLKETKDLDFDIMLEIKDKERSVLKALKCCF